MSTDEMTAAELIEGIATSCASFIAEIDRDSRDVAAYLAQRLAPLATEEDVGVALEEIAADGRRLIRALAAPPAGHEVKPEPRPCPHCGHLTCEVGQWMAGFPAELIRAVAPAGTGGRR